MKDKNCTGIEVRTKGSKLPRKVGWKNEIHRQQWRNTLRDYVYPIIGHLPVADVDGDAVQSVLKPIWNDKPETASRVRGRIETILSAAKVDKLRTGDNPAAWRGNLALIFPGRKQLRTVRHHAALNIIGIKPLIAAIAA